MVRFAPDLLNWHKEGKGVYVRNDGEAKVEKHGDRWTPYFRIEDRSWVAFMMHNEPIEYLSLHAAHDHVRREGW